MKQLLLSIPIVLAIANPAAAQLGGIGGAFKKAQQGLETKQKIDDLTFSEDEERQIGQEVSTKIRERFGVVQNREIHKYVSLVGVTVAQQSERPGLPWTFIVLDTDGVNAFAAPGGFVHITRGALGLIKNEAELAGVLGHEIGHVARKHTLNALRKNSAVKLGTETALSSRGAMLQAVANQAYDGILENSFDRGDEMDADRVGTLLAQKAGYSSGALGDFLTTLAERNKGQAARNGLFASHPETTERIGKIKQGAKNAANVETRYKANIKYEPTPITEIATITEGSAGLAASGPDAKPAEKKEEPKKKGFGLGSLTKAVSPQKESTQVSASGGARGVGPDRAAKGGGNPALVNVLIDAADILEFQKGIA